MKTSAAEALASASDSTGPIFSLSTAVLPFNSMPTVESYLVAPSTCTAMLHNGVLVCGEFVVTRRDGQVYKTYSYVYGVGADGRTVYGAPFKDFPLHHVPTSCSVSAASLLGFHPLFRNR